MDLEECIWTMCLLALVYKLWSSRRFKNMMRRLFTLDGHLCAFARNMSQFNYGCLPRKGWFITLMTFSIIVTAGLIILDNTSGRLFRADDMEETIAVMRTRMKFLESQFRGKQQDLIGIQGRVDSGCITTKPVTGKDESNITYTPELKALLKKIRGSRASDGFLPSRRPDLIEAPFSLKIMPHLMDNPDSLRPAYQFRSSRPRQFIDYIIGVPHVMRDKGTYLFDTIKYLLDRMTEEDKNCTMIAIMIGETNLTYVVETSHQVEKLFPEAVDVGLVEIISPNENYYPNLDALPQTLGDSLKRVKWRTKQNLDAIYLMAFAHSRCLYYLMVEDDVVAADNYMSDIRKHTALITVSNPDWFFIQYSTTGGIGKLFRSTDLIHFMTYVQLFYNNMPIDWLTESYLADRSCGINKGAKECADAKTKMRPTYKNNLFKHIGLFSSLKGKLQKGRIFPDIGQSVSYFPHDNPPLSHIRCDLAPHGENTIEAAYYGKKYFWGKLPRKDNVIEFWFREPTKFYRYLIRTGNLEHVNDIVDYAAFEILPTSHKENSSFIELNQFDEFGLVEGKVDDKYGELLAMRIRILTDSKYWAAITEIDFVPLNSVSTESSSDKAYWSILV